jgi:putative ABC transport system substrate-binding protein
VNSAAFIPDGSRIVTVSHDKTVRIWGAASAKERTDALVIASDPFFYGRREQLAALAARHAIPAIYTSREFPEVGGLMSYGTNLPDVYRQVGVYVGRILKGARPSELPMLQPIKFEFVLNLKTAKTLGVKVSDNLLSLADEVIE